MQSIERAEFVLTVGEQAGADLGEPSRLLQEAIVATKADEHRRALQLAGDAQTKAERILGDRASEKIGALRGALPHLGDDAGTLKALLNRADASMGTRDFEDTFRALDEGEKFVEIQTRSIDCITRSRSAFRNSAAAASTAFATSGRLRS